MTTACLEVPCCVCSFVSSLSVFSMDRYSIRPLHMYLPHSGCSVKLHWPVVLQYTSGDPCKLAPAAHENVAVDNEPSLVMSIVPDGDVGKRWHITADQNRGVCIVYTCFNC